MLIIPIIICLVGGGTIVFSTIETYIAPPIVKNLMWCGDKKPCVHVFNQEPISQNKLEVK